MRKAVENFAEEMESILKENDYKGGWKDTDDGFLEKKLIAIDVFVAPSNDWNISAVLL